jgi:hypothetical protein
MEYRNSQNKSLAEKEARFRLFVKNTYINNDSSLSLLFSLDSSKPLYSTRGNPLEPTSFFMYFTLGA